MPKVTQKHANESFESMIRRFKRTVERADLIKDLSKHEYFEKPSMKRKRRKAAAEKRQKNLDSGGPKKRLF